MSKRTRALKNEIWQLNLRLDWEAECAVNDIASYLKLKDISPSQCLSIQRDIAQMLYDGQEQGRSHDEIIGNNYQRFCDDIIAALPPRTLKQRWMIMMRNLFAALALLWLVAIFEPSVFPRLNSAMALQAGEWDSGQVPIEKWQVLFFGIGFIVLVVRQLIGVRMGWSVRLKNKYRIWVVAIGVVLVLSGLNYIIDWRKPLFFLQETIVFIHIGVCIGVQIALSVVSLILNDYVD